MPRITFLQDEITLEVPSGTPVVLAAAKAGSSHPFGCKRGACYTCLAVVVEGEENLISRSGPRNGPLRLACQSMVKGDVSVRPATEAERQRFREKGMGDRDKKKFRRERPVNEDA